MIEITNITSNARQSLLVVSEEGEEVTIALYFLPTQTGWFADISVGTFRVNGIRIGTSPNILNQYKNLLQFGLRCDSIDGLDPFRLDDFVTRRIRLFVLNRAELAQIETRFFS